MKEYKKRLMTQIISVITKEYVLLASDRMLTNLTTGKVFDENTCKLVSLCGFVGIGYTGPAVIERIPTHHWIAKTLASNKCNNPADASRILAEQAARALARMNPSFRRMGFLMAGWAPFGQPPELRSHVCSVSNMYDESGQPLKGSSDSFRVNVMALPQDKELVLSDLGQPLSIERREELMRNFRRLFERRIGPKEVLRLLVDEIIYTSKTNKTVGDKILGFCIPRESVSLKMEGEKLRFETRGVIIGSQPNENLPAFAYFEQGYNELIQYGPTFICGEHAYTNVVVGNDPRNDFQFSEMQILHQPKREGD